jgi:hypothetical protein
MKIHSLILLIILVSSCGGSSHHSGRGDSKGGSAVDIRLNMQKNGSLCVPFYTKVPPCQLYYGTLPEGSVCHCRTPMGNFQGEIRSGLSNPIPYY